MEDKEKVNQEKKVNNKKGKRVKRQVSIITVFLWVFLVATMIIITASSIRKNNKVVEIESDDWNLQLVMYDRSSDTPNQAITDFTWNATSSSETKQLCMQIGYNCTTGKAYNPGELVIEIPGIGKESFSENNRRGITYGDWEINNVIIAADLVSNTIKKYDWSFSYDEENNIYMFTNNNIIEENEHFEGTIQLVYNLKPYFKIKTDLEYKAKFKENIANAEEIIAKESNACNFHYTSTKKKYTLKNSAEAGAKFDYTKIEDILDDYYWVKYNYNYNNNSNIIYALNEDNIGIDINNNCIKLDLAEGVVLYDEELNEIEPKENNTYYYLKSDYYYIGYPKSKYNEGDSIKNIAELWGRYEDEEEMQKLAEASSIVKLITFDFEYKGNLYGISKSSLTNNLYLNKLKNEKIETKWGVNPIAFCTDSAIDVEIGDDLLYITRENGEVTKLEEDEYNFTQIDIPVFYTYNKYSGNIGEALIGYDYEIQVRHKGTDKYVVYGKDVTSDIIKRHSFWYKDIVGVKVVIKNLDKTLYSGQIPVCIDIYPKDCGIGKVYNFAYLQVYKNASEGNRNLVNEVTLDSYNTPSTLKIYEYDIATYGRYMQRSYNSIYIRQGRFELLEEKAYVSFRDNVKEERYEVDYQLRNNLYLDYYEVNKDVIIKQYDILPLGENLISSKEEIIESITSNIPYENLKLKNGTKFNTEKEFTDYIKENTTIDIDYNYKNSGRTKISIIYNLNGIDWSYYLVSSLRYFEQDTSVEIKIGIPYDSILEYGTSYTNCVYGMWNNQEYGYVIDSKDNCSSDALANDIDNDGDTEEKLSFDYDTLNITHAVSSQQAVIKQVRTDLTKGRFIEETAEVSAGSEYTYKLRVTTGANSLKDLILYDTLETTYNEDGTEITEGWKGEFLNVDTSYAVSKGYAPIVYYSEEKNPGKLTEVPEKWKELTDEVDKTKVKSICVDLRYKADGSEMELSPNNVVFVLINMKAPNDDTLLTSSHNMFSTNWRAIDPLGGVIDNIEGIYSNEVNVSIYREENKKQNIVGDKIWEDNGDEYEKRPESIIVKLMQDGVEYEKREVTKSDNWKYTFENVPVYKNENLEEYKYTIEEEKVLYYTTTYNEYNVINTLTVKSISGEKTWSGYDEWLEQEFRPESITVKLMQDGIEYMRKEVTENEDGEWKYIFEDVPIYKNENKDEYEYTVEEVELPKYTTKYDEYDKYNIINELKMKKLEVTKIWDDNNNAKGLRPKFVLIKVFDGENQVNESYVRADTDWKCTFELPEYREDGSEIEYTVDEVVEEYKEEYLGGGCWDYEDNFENEGDYELYQKYYIKQIVGNTITNKYIDPDEKIKITGTKIWEDEENKAGKRSDSVILQLKSGDEVISEKVATEKSNWKVEFEVPRYDENKNEIKYHIDEKETSKFYVKELTDNFTVTNKFVVPDEKVKIEAIKLWEDLENKYDKRPKKITLQILNGEKVVKEKKVSEKDNWRYEFELPKYDKRGNEIEYIVNEKEDVKYYEKRVSGYTVINKCIYEPPVENEIDKKPSLPNTSDINVLVYVIIFFVAIIGAIVGIIFVRKNKKR